MARLPPHFLPAACGGCTDIPSDSLGNGKRVIIDLYGRDYYSEPCAINWQGHLKQCDTFVATGTRERSRCKENYCYLKIKNPSNPGSYSWVASHRCSAGQSTSIVGYPDNLACSECPT